MIALPFHAALALTVSVTPVRAADIQHAYIQMLRVEAVAIPGHDSVFGLRVDPPAPGALLAGF